MPTDIFATKGTEYLLVVGYFLLLIAIARFISPRPARAPRRARVPAGKPPWFRVRDGYHFHPGHTWAADGERDTVTVGLDDFAAQLIGTADGVGLPDVGAHLEQGAPEWLVKAGDRWVMMVSPVAGDVVELNPAVVAAPHLASDDPYGAGWLFKVRAPNRKVSLRNLLSGELASLWMANASDRLRRMTGAELGVLMTDGGAPVRGFGRALGPDEWRAVTREFFLTE